MGISRTYTYSVLKSAWGIRIKLTAHVMPAGDVVNATSVSNNVWLAQNIEGRVIAASEMELLKGGLGSLAAEIAEKTGGKPVTVMLTDLLYVESDFQVEGLYAAISGWAIEEFGLREREIDVSFDRDSNRYLFGFQR